MGHGALIALFCSAKAWFYIYGTWIFVSEILHTALPWSFIGTAAIFILVNFLRIPPPEQSHVEEILGVDPIYDNNIGLDLDVDLEMLGKDKERPDLFYMKTIAHRGAGFDAPENSISAFRKAKEKGCPGVEFDLMLTSDNVPIVFHDSTVDRVSNGTGWVHEMTWDQLKTLDISTKGPYRGNFSGEKIALFEDAIKECLKLDYRIFIDIKEFRDHKVIQAVLDVYAKYPLLYKKAVVSSFNPIVIYLIRRNEPRITCSLAWRPHYFAAESYSGQRGEGKLRNEDNTLLRIYDRIADKVHKWLYDHLLYYVLGLSAVLIMKDCITAEIVNYWRDRGVRVIAWTVNLPTEKKFFSRVLRVAYMTDTMDGEETPPEASFVTVSINSPSSEGDQDDNEEIQ